MKVTAKNLNKAVRWQSRNEVYYAASNFSMRYIITYDIHYGPGFYKRKRALTVRRVGDYLTLTI